jgi:alpha-galactosidase
MSCGLNRYVPFSTVGQMGSSPYYFRSGFNGGIAFAEDCRPADYPREQLQQAIAEAKRIRPYWFGDFFPLSTPSLDPTEWCVLQYHRPVEHDGIVIGFRREHSPYASYDCELRSIDPDARYEVRLSQSYQPQPARVVTGKELIRYRVTIDDKPDSVLLEYRAIKP